MNDLTRKFYENTDGKFDYVKIKSAEIISTTGKTTLTLVYDAARKAEYSNNRERILEQIKLLLPPRTNIDFDEISAGCASEEIWRAIYGYLSSQSRILTHTLTREMLEISIDADGNASVAFNLPESLNKICALNKYIEKTSEMLSNSFFFKIAVSVKKIEDNKEELTKQMVTVSAAPRYRYERSGERRVIRPTCREKLIGKEPISSDAEYIEDCTKPSDGIVICGTISNYRVAEYHSKRRGSSARKRSAGTGSSVKAVSDIAKRGMFTLTDPTGSIRCVIFPSESDENKLDMLSDGDFIMLSGNIEYDRHQNDGTLQMVARQITQAKEDLNYSYNAIVRLPNDDYVKVLPKKVMFSSQYSMSGSEVFSASELSAEAANISAPLVVFELKTAATKGKSGAIIEIGAVKIKKGRIAETFSSFIMPEAVISDKLAKSIKYNEYDHNKAPTVFEVIMDFYLFFASDNCDLTAYPYDDNVAALTAVFKKLHIKDTHFIDIANLVTDMSKLKEAKSSSVTPLALAERYAEIIISF